MAKCVVSVPMAVVAKVQAVIPDADHLRQENGDLDVFLAGGGTLTLRPPRVQPIGDLDTALTEYVAPSNDTDTSIEAAASVVDLGPKLCREVFACLQAAPNGLTCFELESIFVRQHQTISARLWDLRTRGFIHDSGQRRRSPSRRWAIVWKVGRAMPVEVPRG